MIKEKMLEEKIRGKIIHKYYETVGKDSVKARNLIRKLDFKEDAYLLQCIAQTYFDESLFNDNGTTREFFQGRKLRLAERYIIKAYEINEDCIDVLWTLGKIRKAYNQLDLAIFCFKKIIELGTKNIAKKDSCTDRSLVTIKVNDSKFQLYRLYNDTGDFKLSKRYLTMYKNGLKKGIQTLYKPLDKFLVA